MIFMPLVLLRGLGAFFGGIFLLLTFGRYRSLQISKGDALFRWFIALGLILVSIYPDSINKVAEIFAFKQVAYGRILILLVLSVLVLWWLMFRERQKNYALKKEVDLLVRHVALMSAAQKKKESEEDTSSILVAIPAFNEEKTIKDVLLRMPEKIDGIPVETVVINDGSKDKTAQVAQELGFEVIQSPFQRGQGSALRIGYDLAKKRAARVVVTMDSDGQHQPEEIERVVKPILEEDSDLVIGSRILGEHEQTSAIRSFGILFYNSMINFLLGTSITDCSSGFKAFRVSTLERLDFRENQFQSAEVIITCQKNRCKISEVPITITQRQGGVSKKGGWFMYGISFLRTILKAWWR